MKLIITLIFISFSLISNINAQNSKNICIEDSFYIKVPIDSIINYMTYNYSKDSLKEAKITQEQLLNYEMTVYNVIKTDSSFCNSILLKNFEKIYRSFYLSINGKHSYVFIFYSYPTEKDVKLNCNGVLSFQNDKCNFTYKYIAIIDIENRFKPLIFKSTYK